MEEPAQYEEPVAGDSPEQTEMFCEPPMRPIWRFVIAVLFMVVTDWVALFVTAGIFEQHPLLQEALYRAIGSVILIAGFHLMLSTLDEVKSDVPKALGFPAVGAVRGLAVGTGIGMALVATAVAIVAVAGKYHATFSLTAPSCKRLVEVLVLLVVGATYEELTFRGYAFQRLAMATGPTMAVVGFSVWFGVVHLWNPHSGGLLSWNMANTVVIGVLLAVAYLRTRALWMPIGIHFGWNFAMGTVFGLPVSGLGFFAACVHGKAVGPLWLTGGNYGLEASGTGFIVSLAGFIPVYLLTRYSAQRI